jgi:hypothetical protein
MKGKTILSILGLAAGVTLTLALLLVSGGTAGQYHVGDFDTLLCYDCHTMHFSQAHKWNSGDPLTATTPQLNGDWLGTTGPNEFLLKAPANQLCLSCHNGTDYAPDVLGVSSNPTQPANGREAGALNDQSLGAPYDTWKGHTLDNTNVPPGYNPTLVGLSATWYDNTVGLECTSCHLQHGQAVRYRNLGPRTFPGGGSTYVPTYVIGTTNDLTKDVWVNIPGPYTAGTGQSATFAPYYSTANISFNRIDGTVGSLKYSNKVSLQCAACHANFHGGPGDTTIGGLPGAGNLEAFLRHPTAQTTIGAAGAAGYGGHSSLSRFVANTTKVKVNTTDYAGYTNASPFCLTCHKAHGNQNPFGLIFLNRNATSVDEQGGYGAGQVASTGEAYRNLCGQCHSQGN